MYADYLDAIISAYQREARFNPLLFPLKRSGLKKHCVAVCRDRFNAKDEPVLKAFFGNAEGQGGFLRVINRCSADRFRPLVDILKGQTANPNSVYIELLAWMFDIRPRPFTDTFDYTSISAKSVEVEDETAGPHLEVLEELPVAVESIPMGNVESSIESQVIKPEKPGARRRNMLIVLLLLVSGIGAVGFLSKKGSKAYGGSQGQCMYWSGDRYVSIDCQQKIKNTTVIALDTNLVNNFFRITRPETLSIKSVGKVWYAKVDSEMEFYTSMGYHPVETHLQLKPITKYILEKYVFKSDAGMDPIQSTLALQSSPIKKVPVGTVGYFGQCNGITLKKLRCIRSAKANGYCWQHQGQSQAKK